MTPPDARQLIIEEINIHASSTAMLAGKFINAGLSITAAYGEVRRVTAELKSEGKIAWHEAGCWTLPAGAAMEEEDDKPKGNGLRPGTVVPKGMRHLVPK